MRKLCSLVTSELFPLVVGVSECYDLNDVRQLERYFDTIRDDWINEVYGRKGMITSQVWLAQVASVDGKYIFNARKLREKIFDRAGIDRKDIKGPRYSQNVSD